MTGFCDDIVIAIEYPSQYLAERARVNSGLRGREIGAPISDINTEGVQHLDDWSIFDPQQKRIRCYLDMDPRPGIDWY
jgi:hypothetical protein